jgi:hypothetical protein
MTSPANALISLALAWAISGTAWARCLGGDCDDPNVPPVTSQSMGQAFCEGYRGQRDLQCEQWPSKTLSPGRYIGPECARNGHFGRVAI